MRRYLPITIAILVWSWTTIFIKLLQEAGFDPFSQNVYRYFCASVVLLVLARAMNPSGFRRAARKPWVFIVPAVALAGFQTLWVLGIYWVTPAFAAIIGNGDVLLVVFIALFFADERRVVTNHRYLTAIAIGLASVVLFIASDPRASFEAAGGRGAFLLGTALVLAGSALWVVFAFLSKWLVKGHGAMVLFSLTSVFATALLLAVALAAQASGCRDADLGHVAKVGWLPLLVLVGSGVLNVGMCQALYQHSVRLLGVAMVRGLTPIIPVLTAVFSYLVFGETLTPYQWAYGLILLGSVVYLAFLGERLRARARAAEAPATPEPLVGD
jgi:drug/metabolite transporter (DMT)-like permease